MGFFVVERKRGNWLVTSKCVSVYVRMYERGSMR
jgi:hypothetical protein